MARIWGFVKKIYKKLKNPYFRAKSRYMKYYQKLEIDPHLILLESQHGKNVDGNVFYILKYLSGNPDYRRFRVYLCARAGKAARFREFLDKHGMENVGITILSSVEYFKILASAKYLINDNTFLPFWVKKEGQCYLNTWHGTPLKTLGRRVQNDYHAIGNAQKNFSLADYLLFPNEHTKKAILSDYMLENIATGGYVLSGYPRNEAFFDSVSRDRIRDEMGFRGRKVYAYMPTFRGLASRGGTSKGDAYLIYYLCELDKRLAEDEVVYVNLHPISKKTISFKTMFQHIYEFPPEYETYEFLNAADCLITDYSSVFFDFAVTKRKIVLFPFDKEEYLQDRGTYLDMSELPFPQVFDLDGLLHELRTEKNYDDTAFLNEFTPYEGAGASGVLCDAVILGRDTGIERKLIVGNGKENVLIYASNLAGNGITTSLRSLLTQADTGKRNYYLTFYTGAVAQNRKNLLTFPKNVAYFPITGDMNLSIRERSFRKLFKWGVVRAWLYARVMSDSLQREWMRCYGNVRFDTVIQFNGYESEIILLWSQFKRNRIIFVHSDMIREIAVRNNQRKDVLKCAYRRFKKVAVVTEDIYDVTRKIGGPKAELMVCRNAINAQEVSEKAGRALTMHETTVLYPESVDLQGRLEGTQKKLISIGRFSPEKGHFRLLNSFQRILKEYPDTDLIIIGGNSFENHFELTIGHIEELGLQDNVILVKNMPNPFPILKKCDGFVLSSFHEGFGLVLAEADILGIPVVSTDIPGPRGFMQQHGGRLVENSEEGLYKGMKALLSGEVGVMNVDYESYNCEALQQFEALFS